MSSAHARRLLLAIAVIVLVVHVRMFDFVTDDAYISFVYARNLVEHGQLTFNVGMPPVEGYTNFLWTVLLAGGMALGIPPELSARWLALACAVVTLWLVVRIMDRALGRPSAWSAVPALLLASSSGFACWTSGGLETQLFTMLFVIALDAVTSAVTSSRAIVRAGIALALAALTRPEGLLLAGVLGIVHLPTLIRRAREGGRLWFGPELAAVAVFLFVWAPWFVWRFRYYGHLWPNTYYVKASGPWRDPAHAKEMLSNGAHYLWVWVAQTKLMFAAPFALLGLVVGPRGTPRFTLAFALILVTAAYVPYTISVGGDFMGLHRFVMPLFVVAALAIVLGIHWLVMVVTPSQRSTLAAGLFVCTLVCAGFAVSQYRLSRTAMRWGNWEPDRGIDTPAFLVVYTEDRAAIGRAMAPCFKPDDFSIVGGAGAQPYYGRMRSIDVFGLVSERIAHEEPRVRPRAGHTKFGPDSLVVDYDPTFVFSCYDITSSKRPLPHLSCGGFWRARGYEQVSLRIPGMRQRGDVYTFLAKKERAFTCPGRIN